MNQLADAAWAVSTVAQLQGYHLDPVRLHGARSSLVETQSLQDAEQLAHSLGIKSTTRLAHPDPAYLPLVAWVPARGWGVITERLSNGLWVMLRPEGNLNLPDADLAGTTIRLNLEVEQTAGAATFTQLLKQSMRPYRGVLVEGIIATLFIGVLTLAASMFSMQVYDRVIPTHASSTLAILASGVALVIFLELILKFARSRIMDSMVTGVDSRLSREVFQRLLSVRIDHLPGSVGSLASQVRSYEQVRNFYTASTLFTLADLPVAMIFVLLIAIIGSPWVALVPLIAAGICLILGAIAKRRVDQLATESAAVANRKTGILVETVEGIETIKSGSGGWKFLSRWIEVTRQTIENDLIMRHTTDNLSYWSTTIQQLSYALIVVVGTIEVIDGNMTMGALIACSILGGRVLAPIMAIPGLMVQQAHARAAITGLEQLYSLKTDNHGIARPLTPSRLQGSYQLQQVKFAYGEGPIALQIPSLQIKAGERVAILGPIGSGKSTLLKLLSGLYHPQEGRVLLDNLEMTQISQQSLSQQIGYLQQDHRLFQGTLRENLLIGMPDPGDDLMRQALEASGLMQLVASHPRGLELPISEGGKGLSGGQRQLVAFTRLLLGQPKILLLDEPTASMDDVQEKRCLSLIARALNAGATLILVTHKPSLLPLVDRVLIVSGNRIIMDGPRDKIIEQLRSPPLARNEASPAPSESVAASPLNQSAPSVVSRAAPIARL